MGGVWGSPPRSHANFKEQKPTLYTAIGVIYMKNDLYGFRKKSYMHNDMVIYVVVDAEVYLGTNKGSILKYV